MVRVNIEKGACTYVRALLLVAFVSRLQPLRLHTVSNFCVTNLKISFSSFLGFRTGSPPLIFALLLFNYLF